MRVKPDRQEQLSGVMSLWRDKREADRQRDAATTPHGEVSGAEMLPPEAGTRHIESTGRESCERTPTAPFNSAPTSRKAAQSMTVPTIAHQEAVVVRAVRESADGLTRDEIATATGLLLASVCARVNSLIREGILREHGERKTRSNRAAAIVRVNGTA